MKFTLSLILCGSPCILLSICRTILINGLSKSRDDRVASFFWFSDLQSAWLSWAHQGCRSKYLQLLKPYLLVRMSSTNWMKMTELTRWCFRLAKWSAKGILKTPVLPSTSTATDIPGAASMKACSLVVGAASMDTIKTAMTRLKVPWTCRSLSRGLVPLCNYREW